MLKTHDGGSPFKILQVLKATRFTMDDPHLARYQRQHQRNSKQNIQELAEDLAQQQTKIRNKLKTSRKVKSAQNILTESDMALKRATSNRKSFLNKRVQTAHKHNKKADEIRKKASFYKAWKGATRPMMVALTRDLQQHERNREQKLRERTEKLACQHSRIRSKLQASQKSKSTQDVLKKSEMSLKRASKNRERILNERVISAHKHNKKFIERKKALEEAKTLTMKDLAQEQQQHERKREQKLREQTENLACQHKRIEHKLKTSTKFESAQNFLAESEKRLDRIFKNRERLMNNKIMKARQHNKDVYERTKALGGVTTLTLKDLARKQQQYERRREQELQKKTEKLSHQHSQIRRKLLALQKLDSTEKVLLESEKRLERASDNRESLLNERIAKAHKHNESAVKMEKALKGQKHLRLEDIIQDQRQHEYSREQKLREQTKKLSLQHSQIRCKLLASRKFESAQNILTESKTAMKKATGNKERVLNERVKKVHKYNETVVKRKKLACNTRTSSGSEGCTEKSNLNLIRKSKTHTQNYESKEDNDDLKNSYEFIPSASGPAFATYLNNMNINDRNEKASWNCQTQ